jgi:hypothetical protein
MPARVLFLALMALVAPRFAATPAYAADPGRDAAARRALAWLLAQDDLLDVSASNGFAAGKALCATAMTGFLLEQYPDLKGFARHRARLRRQLDGALRRGALTQGTWSDGLFGLYLAERHLRGVEGGEEEALACLASRIARGQNADGGWSHGGFGISFYPTTLIAATNLSVLALGLARRLGVDVDEAVLADACRLYRDLQSPSGAWPYGGRPYRKGFEAGRTAGAVAALRAVGSAGDLVARAGSYLARNAARVPHGHASPALHLLAGALAQSALGGPYAEAFDEVLAGAAKCQKPDGSFRDFVPHSPDSLAVLGRTVQDEAYLTSLYACALAARRSEVAKLLSGPVPDKPGRGVRAPEEPSPLWRVPVGRVAGLEEHEGTVLVVGVDGTVRRLGSATGAAAADPLHLPVAAGHSIRAAWSAKGLLFCLDASADARRAPLRVVNGVTATEPPELRLRAVRLDDGKCVWKTKLRGLLNGAVRAGDELLLTSRVEAPRRLRLSDGKVIGALRSPPGVVNRALAIARDGRIALTGESEIWALSPQRAILWQRKARSRRGLLAPAKSALVWAADRLVEGTTGGLVRCRNGATGKTIWKHETRAAVHALAATDDTVVVLGSDGTVTCLEIDGALRWRADPAVGEETGAHGDLRVAGRYAAASGPCGRLRVFEQSTGRPRATCALGPEDAWCLAGEIVLVVRDEELLAFSLGQ